MQGKEYYFYILTNEQYGAFYAGVTNNLFRRIYEHKNGLIEGFTKKYSIKNLVYYETYKNINDAITREKQVKNGRENGR